MPLMDRINDNVEEMFADDKGDAARVLDGLISCAVLTWIFNINERYIKGREDDLGRFQPGFLITSLPESDREKLRGLGCEDIEMVDKTIIGWTP